MPDISLVANEVHVWSGLLDWPDQRLCYAYEWLSPVEKKRVDRCRCSRAKKQMMVSRFMLRSLLAAYLGTSVGEVQLENSAWGKPFLARCPDLKFNASHSEGSLLVAVSRHQEVGIDIERCVLPKSGAMRLAKRFFTAEEYRQLLELKASDVQAGFYRGWVRKEAFVKAVGFGLSYGLDQFVVDLKSSESAKLLSVKGSVRLAQSWVLSPLNINFEGYQAALAVQGQLGSIVYKKISELL